MAAVNGKAPAKGEVLRTMAEQTGLNRKQVGAVLESLAGQIKQALGKKGPGAFTVPGLMKITVRQKKAVPAGMRMDPFTKQERMFPAKPAKKVVKVRPLKALKDMVK